MMNIRLQNTLLESQMGLLGAIFLLFIIFFAMSMIIESRNSMVQLNKDEPNVSTVEYREIKNILIQPKLNISHFYIEIERSDIGNLQFKLEGPESILDSCRIVHSPFSKNRYTWSIHREGSIHGEWGVSVVNNSSLITPINAKIHVFNHGTIHACSKEVIISNRDKGQIIKVIESKYSSPKIFIADESCL